MRIRTVLCVVMFCAGSVSAQELTEPVDYPGVLPGPSGVQHNGGCYLLASGTLSPGDVDWVQVTVPFDSARTVVDLDFTDPGARSFLLVIDDAGRSVFTMADVNAGDDNECGIGASSVVLGSRNDSAADMGATVSGVVLDIGVTGANDFGFTGGHAQQFDYEVWVFAGEATPGCADDASCDDGVECTVDVCDASTGTCAHESDDAFCDDGVFCNGAEACNVGNGCTSGKPPCADGDVCDEDADACVDATSPTVDIRPGTCPNRVNTRSRGFVHVAVMGSPGLDPSDIDPSSLMLWRADGVGEAVTPWLDRGVRVIDMGVPRANAGSCECSRRRQDGVSDLLVKFRTGPIVRGMELAELPADTSVELTLSGRTFDGVEFSGSDCIRIARRHKKHDREDRAERDEPNGREGHHRRDGHRRDWRRDHDSRRDHDGQDDSDD